MDEMTTRKVISGTCAVCFIAVSVQEFLRDQSRTSLQVVGSGFLARPTTVITNRHVIWELKRRLAEADLPEDHLYLWFVYQRQGGLQKAFCRFKRYGVVANEEIDVGIIEFVRRPEPEFEQCQPLKVATECAPAIGEPIAVCGYPYGDDSLRLENGNFYRFGPVLQQGFVSAIAPFNYVGSTTIRDILLDVRTAGGMSGAPVVRPDGVVVGVHYAGIEATVAFAVPIDEPRLSAWLSAHDQALGANSPHAV